MASVIPFVGLRYNPAAVGNLADVVTPPYDVIDADAQERYYYRHPNSIVRLEYGKTSADDNETYNRYTRACKEFTSWIKKEVLLPEGEPAVYLYEQEFSLNGLNKIRSGFICGVKLEDYDKGVVLPHEETIPKHKADRLDLMRACGANFSPVFGLYTDQEKQVEQLARQVITGRQPDVNFADETGERHRMWVLTDPAVIGKIQKIMADKQIFIADGHHRYETALNYKKEREAQNKQDTGTYNYIMMTLVNLYDPGVVVLPTHRLIRNITGLNVEQLAEQLRENFSVEEFSLDRQHTSLPELMDLMLRRGRLDNGTNHAHVFGLYAPVNKFYLLQLDSSKALPPAMLPEKSLAWRNLDVSILHTLVLDRILGIGGDLVAKAEHITYTREVEEAVSMVDRGEFQMAFFLNPTLIEEITQVANNGEKMPQKSTFFYPKLITGLVINRL